MPAPLLSGPAGKSGWAAADAAASSSGVAQSGQARRGVSLVRFIPGDSGESPLKFREPRPKAEDMSRFRHLPLSLRGVYLVLVAAPVSTFAVTLGDFPVIKPLGSGAQGLALACYGIGPLVLAELLRKRNQLFPYALIAECAALLAMALSYLQTLPQMLVNIHYAFVVTMVTLAVMLFNRDLLYPFQIGRAHV